MKKFLRWMLALLLLAGGAGAHAAITCTSLQASDYTGGYQANTTMATQSSVTLNCNRTVATDPTTVYFWITADNGLWSSGQNQNNARRTVGNNNYNIRYDIFLTSCSGQQFTGNTTISGTMVWPAAQLGNLSTTQIFWTCINTGQSPASAGAYTDTITMSAIYYGSGLAVVTGTHDVTIYGQASCVINPTPGNVTVPYPALSTTNVVRTTSFGARCSATMPYSLAISPASGTLAGINYNVTLPSYSATGTGAVQTHTVTITAPSGQAGTCAGAVCTQTQTHTLTITY
jgi:hypothetical protein